MARSRSLLGIISLALTFAACGGGTKAQVSLPAPPPPAPSQPQAQPVEKVEAHPEPASPDPVEVLISQAQKQYAAGLKDYHAENMDQARAEFDRALGLMLESKLDLNGDARLKTAFQKLVENIHSLEVAAVAPNGGPIEQRYEEAPIESFSGLTFPVDPNVSQRVHDNLSATHSDLPIVSNEIVEGVVAYLQDRGSNFVKKGLQRMGQYRHVYEETLRQEGLPQDLVYLAAAESAFNPYALSRAGAKGIWQLMLSRAQEYGLKKNRWVDEREDPVKSTDAAVRHLKDLYQMFGDWHLVMAAYNCGPVTIQRAIEKTGYADFWMLHKLGALPRETQNHVPIILAIAIIAQNPKAYGLEVEPDPPVETDVVVLESPVDLRLVAQLINRPAEEIVRLNPGLLRWTTPPNDPQFVLHLPKGSEPTFTAAIAAFPPDKRIWWRAHTVKDGETLTSVARKFKVTSATLAKVNNLEPGDSLDTGSQLVLPLAPGNEASLVRSGLRGPHRAIRYRIRWGDTLGHIARRFDVTVSQIRRWNGISGSRIVAGRTLTIYVPTGGTAAPRKARSRTSTSASPKRSRPSVAKTQSSSEKATSAASPVITATDKSRVSR